MKEIIGSLDNEGVEEYNSYLDEMEEALANLRTLREQTHTLILDNRQDNERIHTGM